MKRKQILKVCYFVNNVTIADATISKRFLSLYAAVLYTRSFGKIQLLKYFINIQNEDHVMQRDFLVNLKVNHNFSIIYPFNNSLSIKSLKLFKVIKFVLLLCIKANICKCPLKIIRDWVIEISLNPVYLYISNEIEGVK